MNLINKLQILLAAMAFTATVSAQQDPNYTFYQYNMNIYNPAFAGSSEAAEFSLGIRSQWAGIEGAPESQSAIFGMPMGKNVGLGASILNDRTFIEQQTWVAIDISYYIDLDEEHRLYFGIKGSANSYDANTNGLVTYGVGQDGALTDYESRFTPNVGAGAYMKHDRYFVSLSAPKLLTPDRLQERDGNAYLGADRMHAYLSGGYSFFLGKTLDLKTMGMFRYVDASPISLEVTGILDFGERFEFGASYRHDESISGLVLFNVSNGFNLGYAYETSIQNSIDGLDNNTHELFMRLRM
ncbi:MAG: type IX secretion system membrane protein PorP/SprF [Flavobacteriaceae bacterium]|jgi:type IX secretion system PorP/SprF family membrane protein|uniref:PorP/SprF family type IX secretion system membrane protein n=1 Tax=Flagellimonas TaxID=444459 RepID=UPI000E21FDA5|nr:type IX secretion system membrane protein PorP/SprF [Flavobacteriaceae bacterium]